MEFSITSLPNEVLAVVFSHLDVKDRLQASLVCWKWLHLINCRSLLNDITVKISNAEQIRIFSSTFRKFKSFYFFETLIDSNSRDLFRYIAPHVETFEFHKCDLERMKPVNFGDLSFNNLKNLAVADCDLWCIFPALPTLIELHLAGNNTITDDGIAILQENLKNLKSLTISCDIVCDPKVYRRFYPRGMTYEKNPSSAILSYLAIKSFISEIASTLSELNFFYKLTALALKELASIKELKLTKISMYDLSECHKSLIDLFKIQKSLKVVHLGPAALLDDNTIDALCTSLPNIIELELIDSEITDNALKKIFQLDQLKRISLNYCRGLTPSGFHKAVSDFKPIHVKYLNLSHIVIPKDSIPLIKRWSLLVCLDISSCQVIDLHIHAISTFLINLQYLNLGHNHIITDYGIAGISVPNYRHPISTEPIEPLYNLKDLRVLHLEFCINLTDAGLITAIKFPFLKKLYLGGVEILKETISVLHSQNKNLKKIFRLN